MIKYALAAADAEIAAMASTTVATLKENILGVLTDAVPTIAIIFAAVTILFFVFKLVRRAIGR